MDVKNSSKNLVHDLSYFGGVPVFTEAKSTSNLVRPEFDKFMKYSEMFFDRKHYTNNGLLVKLLEKRLAKFHDTEYCIAVCSGFWGLVLAITSLALNGKSEIIMPSLTYRRLADIAAWVGLKPRFCEVDSNSLSLNYQTVSACITTETALIMAVHPIVNCCDIDGLVQIGKEHNIPVLFDSVESVYESAESGKVGRFGDAECFSMHASKLLNGFEGGYITTNNSELADRLAKLRTYGFEGQDNLVISGGLNAKLNEIHAAMALANLDELDQQIDKNRQRYMRYQDNLSDIIGIRLLQFDESFSTGYKNIVVELLDEWPVERDKTVAILNAENILARAYYSPPLHQKSMRYPYVPAILPTTDSLAQRFINLPCGEFVDHEDIDKITQLLAFVRSHGPEINQHLIKRKSGQQ